MPKNAGTLPSNLSVANGDSVRVKADGSAWESYTPSTGGGVSDGDKGDIIVSSSGTVWEIDTGVVTTNELGGDITTAGKALLDDANNTAQRATLGLGSIATQNANALSGVFALDGFAIADAGSDHSLTITTTEDLSANRILTVNPNNANRTLTLTGDATLSGTNTGDPQYAPSAAKTIATGYAIYVAGGCYEIATGTTLEIESGAVMEIG